MGFYRGVVLDSLYTPSLSLKKLRNIRKVFLIDLEFFKKIKTALIDTLEHHDVFAVTHSMAEPSHNRDFKQIAKAAGSKTCSKLCAYKIRLFSYFLQSLGLKQIINCFSVYKESI